MVTFREDENLIAAAGHYDARCEEPLNFQPQVPLTWNRHLRVGTDPSHFK
jgi:hypothetical protein